MSDKFNGVKTIIVTRQPLAFYTHHGAHYMNKLSNSGMYTILIITKLRP